MAIVKELATSALRLEVKTAMDTIVEKNVFSSNGGDLVAVADARIISHEVTDLDIL